MTAFGNVEFCILAHCFYCDLQCILCACERAVWHAFLHISFDVEKGWKAEGSGQRVSCPLYDLVATSLSPLDKRPFVRKYLKWERECSYLPLVRHVISHYNAKIMVCTEFLNFNHWIEKSVTFSLIHFTFSKFCAELLISYLWTYFTYYFIFLDIDIKRFF